VSTVDAVAPVLAACSASANTGVTPSAVSTSVRSMSVGRENKPDKIELSCVAREVLPADDDDALVVDAAVVVVVVVVVVGIDDVVRVVADVLAAAVVGATTSSAIELQKKKKKNGPPNIQ
jgi:hypothetical protein